MLTCLPETALKLLPAALLLLTPGLAMAGVADGSSLTCTGDGPATEVQISGPDSATVTVEGSDASFTVGARTEGGKRVVQIARTTVLTIDPADGKGVLSSTNGKGRDQAYSCRNS